MDKTYEIIDFNGRSKQVVEVTMVRQTTVITQPVSEDEAVVIQKALTENQKSK